MFRKKTPTKQDDTITQKVNNDLIVHNMPDKKRLAGNGFLEKTLASSGGFQGSQIIASKNNFKKIGLLIIIGGFIIIGVLVYLSFKFIIKPAANNSNIPDVIKVPQVIENKVSTTTIQNEVINVGTTTLVATGSPINLDFATSSSDNTPPLDALSGSTTDKIIPLIDSDNDGLYDEEEVALGTNANSVDSDSDTYLDQSELDDGYNPNGVGKLEADPALTKYLSKSFGFSILYPRTWVIKEVVSDNSVFFTAPDDSIIQISVSDNSSHIGIASWFADSFPNEALTIDKLKSTANWDGVMGADNLNFYLTDKKHQKIYIISYLPIFSNRLAYPNLFKAMLNSLVLK